MQLDAFNTKLMLNKFSAKLALSNFNAKSTLSESSAKLAFSKFSVDSIILLISNNYSINKNSKLDNLKLFIELDNSIFISLSSSLYSCNQSTINNRYWFYFKNQDNNSIDKLANCFISKICYRAFFVSYIERNKNCNK